MYKRDIARTYYKIVRNHFLHQKIQLVLYKRTNIQIIPSYAFYLQFQTLHPKSYELKLSFLDKWHSKPFVETTTY